MLWLPILLPVSLSAMSIILPSCVCCTQECQAQSLLPPLRMPADDFHLQFNSLPNPSHTTAENANLAELLTNFSDIFISSSLDLGHTQLVQHEIDTGDARPIK